MDISTILHVHQRLNNDGISYRELIYQYFDGGEIVEEEALNLHASVKRRTSESYDNSHCIVRDASGKLSDTAQMSSRVKNPCGRKHPNLMWNSFFENDSGLGIDRIVLFLLKKTKNISFSKFWMTDWSFKVVPRIFGQFYTVDAHYNGVIAL